MEIDALRSFIAFVETGSFTKAGKQVFRSQSAISQQMKKLEQQLNKTLFEKVGRRQILTDEGVILLSYAKRIVELHDEAVCNIKDAPVIRPLIIGCPDDYVQDILMKLVNIIENLLPNLSLRIICRNSVELRKLLNDGLIDIAIVTQKSNQSQGYTLLQEKGIWAFNGDTKNLQVKLQENKSLPLVLYDESCGFHASPTQGLTQEKIKHHIICVSPSLMAIQNFVMAGKGVTVVAESSLGAMQCLSDKEIGFELPLLPEIAVELIIGANAHPNFGRIQLEMVGKIFRQLAI